MGGKLGRGVSGGGLSQPRKRGLPERCVWSGRNGSQWRGIGSGDRSSSRSGGEPGRAPGRRRAERGDCVWAGSPPPCPPPGAVRGPAPRHHTRWPRLLSWRRSRGAGGRPRPTRTPRHPSGCSRWGCPRRPRGQGSSSSTRPDSVRSPRRRPPLRAPALGCWARTIGAASRAASLSASTLSAANTRCHTPLAAQRLKRRGPFFQSPNRAGRSRQGLPAR